MKKEDVLQTIRRAGIVAVVRGKDTEEARSIVERCIAGGVRCIELTFTVPFAHRVIEELAREYGERILLGAGTVLDPETARIAILSGAQFVVSPHLNPEVIRLCNRYRVANMAGIMTISEAVTAMESGCDLLKLFPGELSGPKFIKAIHGPLPQAEIMPTGGVSVDNVGEWLAAGAVAVGAGGRLTKGDITANARAFVEQIERFHHQYGQ